MNATYYPGCSLEGTARDYADSIHGVCASLGIELEEVPDWNCCGATAAHSIHHKASIELAGRNLKLAAQLPNKEMLVPCPLCYNRLKAAYQVLGGEEAHRYRVTLDPATPEIWDLANFLATDEMLGKIKERVRKPLNGFRVVCYYGCQASRPPSVTGATDWENPQSMDKIMKILGAKSILWPYKTDCCGASLMLSRPDMGSKLVGKLYDMARRVGAQAMVVSCQMCQSNLDMYQEKIEKDWGRHFALPVLYFTELIGLAMGIEEADSWMSRHFADPGPVLRMARI
ncbi:MAG: CoB--CoM heterodisulfide reductase iron-sulfur subunit B family protein [Syntrophobacteraceae bacterium]|nr:CoB--CoM heterodisulfide reductase iron-sulfur subunit B family protein [Syntrophobacteraceae bacterium]